MRRRALTAAAAVVVLALVAGTATFLLSRGGGLHYTAYFSKTVGIYPGSDVRVLGVQVGTVTGVHPMGAKVRVDMSVNPDPKIPAGASAVIVPPSLVSDRYIALTPAYRGGPTLPDGATISEQRTATPVEYDEAIRNLDTLVKDLGPTGVNKNGALSNFVAAADQALRGNGARLHSSITNMSDIASTLADDSGDVVGLIHELAQVSGTLAGSDADVRKFEGELSAVSGQLAGERSDLGAAVQELAVALAEVHDFAVGNRQAVRDAVAGLTRTSQTLENRRRDLMEIDDLLPVAISGVIGAYDMNAQALDSRIDLPLYGENPALVLCQLVAGAGLPQACPAISKALAPVQPMPAPTASPAPHTGSAR